MIKFWDGRLLGCRLYSGMFIGYRKALFSQDMSDGKKGGPIEKKSLKYHICFEVRVVGHPKMIKFPGGRLLCCRWCSRISIGYKKVFFSQNINDGKVGGLSKTSIFWASYFLWIYGCGSSKNDQIPGWPSALLSLVFNTFIGYKEAFSPNIWATEKQSALSKKGIFWISYLL